MNAAIVTAWCVWILAVISVANTADAAALAQESDDDIFAKVEQLTESNDLAAMSDLAKDIRLALREAMPVRYGKLTLKVCTNLATYDFHTSKQYGLASELALEALADADKMPLEMELAFVERLRYDADRAGPLTGAKWENVRTKQAQAWLHARQGLQALLAEQWDPEYRPALKSIIPGFEDLAAGADPSVIPDPKRRQQYIDALTAERARAERYREHAKANTWVEHYYPLFDIYIATAYSKPPYDNAELEKALNDNGVPDDVRRRILATVQSNQKAAKRGHQLDR